MTTFIDLRSDTFSIPSEEMYEAVRRAPLGDDVYEEDPTVHRLQELAAELTGHEAALLVTSGTQGNLTALLTHCRPGDELIVGANTDLYNVETSGLAAVAGLLARPVDDRDGAPSVESVVAAVRPDDIHAGRTGLLALENSHQQSGGTPIEPERVAELAAAAHDRGVAVHLDGARVFNAAVALGVPASEIGRHVDSLTFCLSKGLSCPVGSVLCGSTDFISRARRMRKMLGGGTRQAGWFAAAGIVALGGRERLAEDHANARVLADALASIDQVEIDPARVRTNIVYFQIAAAAGVDADELTARMWTAGVRAFAMGGRRVRLVVHRTISRDDVLVAAATIERALAGEFDPQAGLTASGYAG